jgi:hypothetical protein
MTLIDWRKRNSRVLFYRSRGRHWAARKATSVSPLASRLAVSALSRVGPEIRDAAMSVPSDLYIAHNIGALPATFAAAAARSGKVGFDAEDFHSGQRNDDTPLAAFTRTIERRLLAQSAYVTAAAPGIAEAYRDLCGIPLPTCILNVFPLRDRPLQFRPASTLDPVRLYWFSQTIGPDRGLEDAVRAMGLLSEHHVELHLRGCWQPGYEARLRRVAAESGVPMDRIISHAPGMPDDMVRLAAGYDVGLALEPGASTNNDIALSNKIFTYLLAGNALLATRTVGQSRLMPDLLAAAAWCEAGQPDSLARALLPWLDQRAALLAARETAWHLGETRFNWDLEKSKFLEVVAGALEKSRSCP